MKALALFLVIMAVVTAQVSSSHSRARRAFSTGAPASAAPTPQPATPARGRAFAGHEPVNYGPKVYGRGALNRWAVPPNPFAMSRALAFVENFPGALIRLDLDGEISITDRFGQDLEAIGPYGQEIDLDF